MTAAQSAENQARLNVQLRDIVTFFQESGIQEHSVELMNSFIEKNLTSDFLSLVEGYGECMAFIKHDELVEKLEASFNILIDGYVIERKLINKKLRFLKEDKKTDPEVLIRLENMLSDLDNKKALAMVSSNRLRAMKSIPLEKFMDENFDPIKHRKAEIQHVKDLLKVNR